MLYAIFTNPEAGYDGDGECAIRKGLKVGEKYLVTYVGMGQSYTGIGLEGIEGSFNSILFKFKDENGVPVNIYRDPKYNPYMSF